MRGRGIGTARGRATIMRGAFRVVSFQETQTNNLIHYYSKRCDIRLMDVFLHCYSRFLQLVVVVASPLLVVSGDKPPPFLSTQNTAGRASMHPDAWLESWQYGYLATCDVPPRPLESLRSSSRRGLRSSTLVVCCRCIITFAHFNVIHSRALRLSLVAWCEKTVQSHG